VSWAELRFTQPEAETGVRGTLGRWSGRGSKVDRPAKPDRVVGRETMD